VETLEIAETQETVETLETAETPEIVETQATVETQVIAETPATTALIHIPIIMTTINAIRALNRFSFTLISIR
jgi:hypothetical protein